MNALMAQKKSGLRQFTDRAKLIARGLPELRHEWDREVTRLRWQHEVRVGGEPVSLTTLGNALVSWYLGLAPEDRDRVILPALADLDGVLRAPEPDRQPPPAGEPASPSGPFRALPGATFRRRPLDEPEGQDQPPVKPGRPKRGR